MIKAVVVGGSGYVGGELIRLLLFHPKVKVIAVSSNSNVGKKIVGIHANLTGMTDLLFEKEDIKKLGKNADVIFFALPAGESMSKIKQVNLKKTKVIDLGPDFRLKDKNLFKNTYGFSHTAINILTDAIYGLPEINKKAIKNSSLVASPGCFPTSSLLALFPFAKNNLLTKTVIINSVTGSSGSGIKLTLSTHHPERANNFMAYNIFSHRHQPEIKQTLDLLQGSSVDVVFTTHSAPMVRGIFTTTYIFLEKLTNQEEIEKLFHKTYENNPFVRMVKHVQVSSVVGTNYCDIAVFVQENKVIITSAIDNLIKGAAGQGIQNMNIMFGLPETIGLLYPGMHP